MSAAGCSLTAASFLSTTAICSQTCICNIFILVRFFLTFVIASPTSQDEQTSLSVSQSTVPLLDYYFNHQHLAASKLFKMASAHMRF